MELDGGGPDARRLVALPHRAVLERQLVLADHRSRVLKQQPKVTRGKSQAIDFGESANAIANL